MQRWIMPYVMLPDLTLAYEAYGRPAGPCVVLLHGAAMQLTDWPRGLVESLGAHFRVLAFDLRDSGKSTKFGPCRTADVRPSWVGLQDRARRQAPYVLFDMAQDVVQAMRALEIERGHLVGYSMGGMVGQLTAALYPDRVRSLTCLMSSGGQAAFDPDEAVREALLDACTPSRSRTEAAETLSRSYRAFFGSGQNWDAAETRAQIERSYRRSYCPAGVYRQLTAILSTGDRQQLLREIACPTLLVHGTDDRCIDLKDAEAAKHLIPDCTLRVLEGLGHEFTPHYTDRIADLVVQHCAAVPAARSNPSRAPWSEQRHMAH